MGPIVGDQPRHLGPAQAGHLFQVAPQQAAGFAGLVADSAVGVEPAPPNRKPAGDFRLRTGSLRWRLEKPRSDPGSASLLRARWLSILSMPSAPGSSCIGNRLLLQAHLVLEKTSYSATDLVGVSLLTSTDSVFYGAVVYSTSLAREVPCRSTCQPSWTFPGAGHAGGNSIHRLRIRVPRSTGGWNAGRGDPLVGRGSGAGWPGRQSPLAAIHPADAEKLRLLVESARIRLAYAHDRQFAVSLSGIRTLPHQIEAVYMKMLPQPRLRFLLADDPGAGKTIMAGLLLKEMKLREAIERILILCPAPLTIQWQDELLRWFGEPFEVIFSAVDQQQLVNPWQRATQVIASLDYAKQDDVRERVWQQRWDLVIIDEAHKCSAYTKRSSGRGDEVEKTRRYQLAERLAADADHLLLLTATPHHGDDDRFSHFVRLIDPDLFPEPTRVGERAGEIRRDILSLGENCPWALRRLKEDLRDIDGQRLFPDRHAHTVTFRLNHEEFDLYKAVTAYINEFLPQASGRKKQSVALTRTVLQRRLASSTQAIAESIRRRFEKQEELLEELESLSPAQRAKRLAQIQGRLADAEQDEDDLDDAERDLLTDEFTTAVELDQLRAEIAALRDLLAQARRVRDHATDSKLTALRDCLAKAEFNELKDGRGRLLIFTEHRDTLNHLLDHLDSLGILDLPNSRRHESSRAEACAGRFPHITTNLRCDRGCRRRHQPPVLPADD